MIECQICGAKTHSIQLHLLKDHLDWSLDEYKTKWPDAPLLSAAAIERIEQRKKDTATTPESHMEQPKIETGGSAESRANLHEVFGITDPKAMNSRGQPIKISILSPTGADAEFVPMADPNHVWEIDTVKDILMAFELNMPLYVWGFHGTGKTTDIEQVCNRTKRPLLRVQHTINTEEAHIIGQWIVKDRDTVFNPGPLALAMRNGWVYLADEYDFALPSVLSVYQPVLEGKPLVIKDADDSWRVVKPHPNFRFAATGNSNGAGDETGLYQGVSVQNAANYDRFAMCIRKHYMKAELETAIIVKQAGISEKDAAKFVAYAKMIREGYEASKITTTISPRALLNAAKIGLRKADWKAGLQCAFVNKLNKVDAETAKQIAQRTFG